MSFKEEALKHIEWAHKQQEQDGEFEFSVRDNAILAVAYALLSIKEHETVTNNTVHIFKS